MYVFTKDWFCGYRGSLALDCVVRSKSLVEILFTLGLIWVKFVNFHGKYAPPNTVNNTKLESIEIINIVYNTILLYESVAVSTSPCLGEELFI